MEVPLLGFPGFRPRGNVGCSSIPAVLAINFPRRFIHSLLGPSAAHLCMRTRNRGARERQLPGEGMRLCQFGMRASIVRSCFVLTWDLVYAINRV